MNTKSDLAWKIAELEQLKTGGQVFQYTDYHKPNKRVDSLMRKNKDFLYSVYINLSKEFI
jgi:hypothetical protein